MGGEPFVCAQGAVMPGFFRSTPMRRSFWYHQNPLSKSCRIDERADQPTACACSHEIDAVV